MLGRYSSEIRTGCANERPPGLCGGHQATGVPTAIANCLSPQWPNARQYEELRWKIGWILKLTSDIRATVYRDSS